MIEKLIFIVNNKKKSFSWNKKCFLCLLPELVGIILFYLYPFCRAIFYSLIDNQFHKKFVGISNYIITIQNKYFCLAMKNSILLLIIAVPFLMLLVLFLAFTLFLFPNRRWLQISFFLPILLPSAAAALVWQNVFLKPKTVLPLYLLFLWKNTGMCLVLLNARFSAINSEILDAAKIDGAGKGTLYLKIMIPMALPVNIFDFLLSIINSFRIFRESYLYYGGNYPPEHSYTLQYYMNNNFLNLNYQRLSSSGVLVTGLIVVFVLFGLHLQKKVDWE